MKIAKLSACLLWSLSICAGGVALAGDDTGSSTPAASQSAHPSTAEIESYLHSQKVTHMVQSTAADGKGDAASVTVKIYGVDSSAQQDEICTSLAATVKKTRLHGVSVLFYIMAQDNQPTTFSPSQLPSGNGDVNFGRDTEVVTFKLQRTVRL